MRTSRALAVRGFASTFILLPFLAGCEGDKALSEAYIPGFDNVNNGRSALMATQGSKTAKTVLLERSKIDFDTSSGKADFEVAIDSFHDIKGMDPSNSTTGLFFNADATAVVMPQPDADGNGVDDTFFVMTEHNLPGQRFERALSYVGPFTQRTVIEHHRQNDMHATYTGKAGVMGTIGESNVNATGTLKMNVDFKDARIEGEMALTGAPQFDGAGFEGRLTGELNDFWIDRAFLTSGNRFNNVTSGSESAGVGSFVGANGQGTMGSFAISSTLSGTGETANVHGWFIGSADSLK